jgi:predicted small integral membrane protein
MNWMAWTLPTALFFAGIGLSLMVLTLCELRWPTQLRRGFLPMQTTRGDRFFISLLAAAFVHLLWLGTVTVYLPIASALSVILAVLLMRWG